jgi:hypothetical protein
MTKVWFITGSARRLGCSLTEAGQAEGDETIRLPNRTGRTLLQSPITHASQLTMLSCWQQVRE